MALLLLILIGCANNNPIVLNSTEVRNYQGEKLSSINDFHENSIKGPQYIDINSYKLEISGLVEEEKQLTYDEVLSLQKYSKVITLYCVEGWDVTILWEGVLLKDVIGKTQPGANTVIFYAYDGYSSSLPLDYIVDNDIMLAYKINNATIPPERGFPFQVVAEDRWGYKWVKWVTKIDVTNDPTYRGYWEQRGYNNDGSHEGPIFER